MKSSSDYLKEFSAVADTWFTTHSWFQERFYFFQKFFDAENLRNASWEDFQKMGDQLHCFNSLAIAKNKALGSPNHSIEHYRAVFEYLVRGTDPIDVRIDKLQDSGSEYYLKFFGKAAISELVGTALPDQYVFYNRRDIESVNYLGIRPEFERGDSFGEEFVKYNVAIRPLLDDYQQTVGLRTATTACLELDQFFSWLYSTHIKPLKSGDDFNSFLQKFISQAQTNDIHRSSYPKSYKGFKVKVGFGTGVAANIPWIAFLTEGHKVRDGIFPGYFYFKSENIIILAYAVSEENKSSYSWPGSDKKQTIQQWFRSNLSISPRKYGDSFVKAVYKLDDELDPAIIQSDLDAILQEYREIGSDEVQESVTDYNKKKYWLVAPGEGGRLWEEFYDKGIIGIGWDDLGDLTAFDTRDDIQESLSDEGNESANQWNNSLCLWEFSHVIQNGDIIIAKKGMNEYIGYGVVVSDYYYDETRKEYKHLRKVDWKKKGTWEDHSGRIVLKTLTDITKYPDYVDRLKRIIGIEQAATVNPDEVEYYWLNANPKYWKIDDFEVGDEQQYTTHNEKGNKRNKYEYFQKIKPGDLVIGYETTPTKKVIAIFEATRGAYIDDDDGLEKIAIKIQQFLPTPVTYEAMKEMPEMSDSEVMKNNQGTLFRLTKEEFNSIINRDLIKNEHINSYTLQSATKDIFMSEEQLAEIKKALEYKKNIILQGPPGVGKTFMAKRLAYLKMGVEDSSRIEMIQFHQSYSYEDFMQGYKPKENGFKLENGIFYRFCKRAQADPGNDYFFIIDEINRGNLSKIFGELMLLIEADKRGEENAVSLTYSLSNENRFYIPENLYIIGTMNTADRSLAVVDYALRRRFAFTSVYPCFSKKFKDELINKGVNEDLIQPICDKIERLNKYISEDKNLGHGFLIGHSYFLNVPGEIGDEEWYERIIAHELKSLLEEYWFDEQDTLQTQLKNLELN